MVITFSRKLYFQKNYYIPYFQLKLQKIIPILDASSNVTENGQNRFGEHDLLGVNWSLSSKVASTSWHQWSMFNKRKRQRRYHCGGFYSNKDWTKFSNSCWWPLLPRALKPAFGIKFNNPTLAIPYCHLPSANHKQLVNVSKLSACLLMMN